MIRIRTHEGQALELPDADGLTLAQGIFLAGLWEGVPLCAGLGKCGLCRVRYLSPAPAPTTEETKRLGAEAVGLGWRLSCLHPAAGCDIDLPEPKRSAKPRQTRGDAPATTDAAAPLLLAVDLGTTSIHWSVCHAEGASSSCAVLASGQGLNPQMGLGSEVMARLAFAARPGGQGILANLVLDRLRQIIHLAAPMDSADHGRPPLRLCVAGNSAMTYILLGLPTQGLASAPYRLDYAGGDERQLAPDLPPALIPPLLAPFVGADLSAGLAALHFGPVAPQYPFLLADLGTNGEFVLALGPEEYLLASVPMGPALEGVGLRHGRAAAPGAVRAYSLSPAGLAPLHVDRPPQADANGQGDNADITDAGITGVGYLSLAAVLLRAGVLDESGRFVVPATPLGRRIAQGLTRLGGESALPLPGGMLLPASDVEELVKVKAAFNLALSRLLAEANLAPDALRAVYLAGAMGEHVDAADLATLGFLPEALAAKVRKAGNTSLLGAQLLLRSAPAWDWVCGLPAYCRALDLASEPRFGSLYVERMVLRHVS